MRTISIETNPNHLEADHAAPLSRRGRNTLLVGVQSFDDGLLAGMDRLEKYGSGAQIRERLAAIRGIFPTLNVDMIFNLPGQTLAMLNRRPRHPARTRRRPGVVLSADDRLDRTLQDGAEMGKPTRRCATRCTNASSTACSRYHPSSAWCFSRNEGMFDEYIIDQDDYVGVGSGAFSYVGGAMYSTTFSLNHYCGASRAARAASRSGGR